MSSNKVLLAKQVLDSTLGVAKWIRAHGSSIGMKPDQAARISAFGEKAAGYQEKIISELAPRATKNTGMSMG